MNEALKAVGLVTWFDEDRMRGDVVAQMTAGIDQSSFVLVFVTNNYIQKVAGQGRLGANDNCKVPHLHKSSFHTRVPLHQSVSTTRRAVPPDLIDVASLAVG